MEGSGACITHVQGLRLAARGDDRGATEELTSAIYSLTAGYTRTNYELARVYLRERRPREAVTVLQPGLRGALDASNLYLNRIEPHELLAQAWDSVGDRDSAAAHYAVVARAWSTGDALFRARAERARRRVASLAR
jgi:predicted Zn-dependent protease